MNYQIDVDFDDDNSGVEQARIYYRVLEKYDIYGMGHEKTKTSTLFISSKKPLDIGQLVKDLENIKILSIRKSA